MSYQVLARKWRPQSFDEVVGQDHVTTPLRNAIRADRVPHALLLCGPRGVGKTSLARILARCLNCEKGPTETPCGECPSCREISGGRSTDVQEIDAASRTSVDDVRELIEAVRYAPSPGKHRIYVVDEVHMLSTAAFNALLKTLEEPPPRTLFVFATTNPEKIPFTVVSRCQRFDLRRIGAKEIAARLETIARAEKVAVSPNGLLAIAREADGSLRDAETLLDQVIASAGEQIDDEQIGELLDLVDRRLLLAILEACVAEDGAAALAACARAGDTGIDAKRLGEHLLLLLRDLLVLRIAPDAPELVEGSDDEREALRALAERTDAARLRRMFRALLREQEDLAWAPQPFAVLEMAVVRLATLPPGDDVARLLARLEALERRLAGGASRPDPTPSGGSSGSSGPAPGAGAENAPSRPRRSRSPRSADGPSGAEPAQGSAASTAPGPTAGAPAGAEPPAPLDLAPEAPPGAGPDVAPEVLFDRLRGVAGRDHPGLAAALEGGRVVRRTGERLVLRVPRRFSAQRLRDRQPALASVCERFFGQPIRVEIECEEELRPASAGDDAATSPEELRRLRQAALKHPGVNATLEVLEGEIAEIRPLGPQGSPGAGGPGRAGTTGTPGRAGGAR